MKTIAIICPDCGCSRAVDSARIPPRPVHATCPACGSRFPFSGHLQPPASPVAPSSPPSPSVLPSRVDPPAPTSGLPVSDDNDIFDPFPEGTFDAPPAAMPQQTLPPAAPPPPAEPEGEPAPPEFVTHRLVFTGTGREYFGIWIVNLLLKIVTLGIYSAWAKVRQRRYFYGNTLLGKAPFDYTGDPLAILKGWLIGAGIFLVYSFGSQLSPLIGGTFGILFFVAMPWLVVRSRLFNQRNSVHRNIRFTFEPDYNEAYLVFAGLPLLAPFTLGLLMPYVLYRQKKFLVEKSGYGNLRASFLTTPGEFYRFFLKVGLGSLAIVALGGIAAALLAPVGGDSVKTVLVPVLIFSFLAFYFFVIVYVQTSLTNLTWNATCLGDAWFISTLRSRDMAWLYLSNIVAIVCSLGLLTPWAKVRMMRYRCERLELSAPADLRALAVSQGDVSAGGEEIGDIFGVDIGL